VDAYPLAFVHEALGQPNQALEELERAGAENSPNLFMLDVDPRLDGLRSHPRFTRLRNRIFRSLPAQRTPASLKESVVISTYAAKDSAPSHRAAS
jgi:hypothetical protein